MGTDREGKERGEERKREGEEKGRKEVRAGGAARTAAPPRRREGGRFSKNRNKSPAAPFSILAAFPEANMVR